MLEGFVQLTPWIVFFVLAGMITGSALLVVTARNVVHSAVFLVFTFLGIAGIFILLQAEFIAITQILIYVGAVTTLLLFAIMLTNQKVAASLKFNGEQVVALGAVGVLTGLVIWSITRVNWPGEAQSAFDPSLVNIGQLLFGYYLIPFEVVSLVLLVALIGAIVVARKEVGR